MKTLAQALAQALVAKKNCDQRSNDEWSGKWQERIDQLCKLLPSGSGIDCGTNFAIDISSEEKLIFSAQFHHMDEMGSYDGWTAHSIIVTPTFLGIAVKVGGQNRNDIKDYLQDVYFHAFIQDAPECPWAK